MREIEIIDSNEGLEATFDRIMIFSEKCRYNDCTHKNEMGCAVLEAVEKGEIDCRTYENYLKIEKEKEHFELSVLEKRKKEKAFVKMVKHIKNDMHKINNKHGKSKR